MKACMAAAGLVSPHLVVIVLELEAASFHRQRVMGELTLQVGNKLLVADIGGGTSDIVVQDVVSVGNFGYRVKDITISSRRLCGGTYIDSWFMDFLEGRIGPSFPKCIMKHLNVYGQLLKEWELTKSNFGCGQNITTMNLPNKLAIEWKASEREKWESSDQKMGSLMALEYDELEISYKDMQSIFDPVVQENLDLIQQQLVEAGDKVKVLVLVGGFTESPYLIHRIMQTFEGRVGSIICPPNPGSIICPPNPGSAICQGALALALNPHTVVSRIYKRTYGFAASRPFQKGVDPIEHLEYHDGLEYCQDVFSVLVKKGDEVMIDKSISYMCTPLKKNQRAISIPLFSCEERNPPRYTTEGLVKEGGFVMDILGGMKLEKSRSMEVSSFLGGSFLEVKVRAVNFMAQQVQLPVEVDYLLN